MTTDQQDYAARCVRAIEAMERHQWRVGPIWSPDLEISRWMVWSVRLPQEFDNTFYDTPLAAIEAAIEWLEKQEQADGE